MSAICGSSYSVQQISLQSNFHLFAIFLNPPQEFYHTRVQNTLAKLPRILGMTASPIDGKGEIVGVAFFLSLIVLKLFLHHLPSCFHFGSYMHFVRVF
jgi:hypothetical protein